MAKRYKMVRVPEDVFEDWQKRKNKIQERIKIATNKPKKISLTGVLKFYGRRKAYIFDDEVVNFFNDSKRKKSKLGGEIL